MAILNQLQVILSIVTFSLLLTGCSYWQLTFAQFEYKLSKCPAKDFVLPTKAVHGDFEINLTELGEFRDFSPTPAVYEAGKKPFLIFSSPGDYFYATIELEKCSLLVFVSIMANPYEEDEEKLKEETLAKAERAKSKLTEYSKLLLQKTTYEITGEPKLSYIGNWESAKKYMEKYAPKSLAPVTSR